MKSINTNHTNESGFTLIEVGVIAPILVVIALALFTVLFALVQSSDQEKARIDITYEKQAAMNAIEADVRLSNDFLTTNETNMTDPYASPNPSYSNLSTWNFAGTSATNRVLILRSYATSGSGSAGNPLSGTRQPVYIGTGTCSTSTLQSAGLLSYDTVYFVYNPTGSSTGTLYRRRLVDTSTSVCTGYSQYQKLSCPSLTVLGSGSRNAACGADDEVIATNVSNFAVSYYLDGSATSATDVYSGDSSGVGAAKSISVTLGESRKTAGQTVTASSTLRMATINL